MDRVFERECWVARPIAEVFDFFSKAENLERITPPHLRFHILTPKPVPMAEGTLIDYRIALGPWRMRWQSVISVWQPTQRFVDEQVRGPYKLWRHEHTFVEQEGGTLIRDQVMFRVPGWIFEPLIYSLFVWPQLQRIFSYRAKAIAEIFA